MSPFSLYIHVPFCAYKCPYCDFNTYALPEPPESAYTEALLRELSSYAGKELAGRPLRTIYFGGGTPSMFAPASIARIIGEASSLWPLEEGAEISLEANPDGLPAEKLQGFREAGVNRLSLGSQSFTPRTLTSLGRRHAAEDIESAVLSARKAGMENVSLDLIYGAPGETLVELRTDLERTLALSPDHVSTYSLTIEKGTPFFVSFEKGILKLPEEERVVEMMEEIFETLGRAGIRRYEISNFGKPGFESRHNLAYWNGDDYLGAGAGAHGFLKLGDQAAKRWANLALPKSYMEAAKEKGRAESWKEELGKQALEFELLYVGLRKIAGVSEKTFEERFERTVDEAFPGAVPALVEEGLASREGGSLRLTPRGLMLYDSVLQEVLEKQAV